MIRKDRQFQIIFSSILLVFSFVYWSSVQAEQATDKGKSVETAVNQVPSTQTSLTLAVASKAEIQAAADNAQKVEGTKFKEHAYKLGPHLQLEYVPRPDGKLNIRLKNSGPAVRVAVFSQEYDLGPNDVVELPQPNIASYYIHVTPHTRETIWRPLWSRGQEREFLVIIRTVQPKKAIVESK